MLEHERIILNDVLYDRGISIKYTPGISDSEYSYCTKLTMEQGALSVTFDGIIPGNVHSWTDLIRFFSKRVDFISRSLRDVANDERIETFDYQQSFYTMISDFETVDTPFERRSR